MQANLKSYTEPQKGTQRVFHHIKGKYPGATIVFFAGIHGNEFAGVKALDNVLQTVLDKDISGEIYGIYGNTKALRKNKRFLSSDLNRMWTSKQLEALKHKKEFNEEELEQKELFDIIEHIVSSNKAPIYFIDLHTTSSKTLPFITINDALINRRFSSLFPVPIVLGIEEYLEGPLLSYLNTLGFVSLGFESGQHTDPKAVINCEAFIYLTLNHTGSLIADTCHTVTIYEDVLKNAAKKIDSVFEVVYKHHIQPKETFIMEVGFKSFQNIKKGMLLAKSNDTLLYSDFNAMLFMPLYQKSGNDGFFIIKPISSFLLKLSELLRKIKADSFLVVLPGISWHNKSLGILKANLSTTRFMAKSIFHLFGYRNKQLNQSNMLLYNRERVAKNDMYKNENWYKS
jgi:succinylglutamate desuccinylase